MTTDNASPRRSFAEAMADRDRAELDARAARAEQERDEALDDLRVAKATIKSLCAELDRVMSLQAVTDRAFCAAEHDLERVTAERDEARAEAGRLRAKLEHLTAALAALHAPAGPYCSECDEQGGELKNPACPHAPRYCRTCWRNEDAREPWPCPTAKAIAEVPRSIGEGRADGRD